MANPFAGEVSLEINGVQCRLKLTLGALASLEQLLKSDSLVAMVDRFEMGHYKSKDVLLLLFAGLKGAGWTGDLNTLASAEFGGGLAQAAKVAAQLLAVAFALPKVDA